jgi:hypothetical protein
MYPSPTLWFFFWEGGEGHRPNRASPDTGSTRHVPPATTALSPHHRTLQHPAARALTVTWGLTDYDEFNPTSWILGPCVRTHAPSRHMTNIGQAGSRHPSPRVGQARIRPHHSHQPRESHLRFRLSRPKRASELWEGIHHSPSPPSPISADSEHPSRRETWSAKICSPGIGPSRGVNVAGHCIPWNMTATGSSTPAPYGRHWLWWLASPAPSESSNPTTRAGVHNALVYSQFNGTYWLAEQ